MFKRLGLFSRRCLLKLILSAALNLSELLGFCCLKICQNVTLYTELQLSVRMKFYAYPTHNSLGRRLNQHSFVLLSERRHNSAQG